MQLDKILSISGRPGLFEMEVQTRSGITAISLIDDKRISSPVSRQISFLSEIQVYCIGKEVPLNEIFNRILKHESGSIAEVSPKASNVDLKSYFFEIIEDYDEERVYPSDIKKIIQWYNLLVTKNIIALEISKSNTKKSDNTSRK
jgi:hypothetical protein